MSYPRRKTDLCLLILEQQSCEAMEYAAKQQDPTWDFKIFEGIHFGYLSKNDYGEQYDAFAVMKAAETYLDELDRQRPYLVPLERGTHYAWELFVEPPRKGESNSTRMIWNQLARGMSRLELPMTQDEFIDRYSEVLQGLLKDSVDMGDRFYVPALDLGGWSGGIISKDFLVEGLKILVTKLEGPYFKKKPAHKEDEMVSGAAKAGEGQGPDGSAQGLADSEAGGAQAARASGQMPEAAMTEEALMLDLSLEISDIMDEEKAEEEAEIFAESENEPEAEVEPEAEIFTEPENEPEAEAKEEAVIFAEPENEPTKFAKVYEEELEDDEKVIYNYFKE